MIESKYPEKAAEWYCQASEVTMIEDRPRQAAEYANKAVRIYLKLKLYDEAVNWIRKAINYLIEAEDNQACGRLVVSLILIQLARDDIVAAQKAYQEGKRFVFFTIYLTISLTQFYFATVMLNNKKSIH
jgi:tetratricopeptide (TPR) repeat protein